MQNTLAARNPTHVDRLEAESIFILRQTVAEAERPVMLHSIGKGSAVMLHLANKAFFRGALHIGPWATEGLLGRG
jgi:3'-phosphoadenosine 5'-phosphosulfate sulfotransferase (PAPS reductase)/FAD synthetase